MDLEIPLCTLLLYSFADLVSRRYRSCQDAAGTRGVTDCSEHERIHGS